MSASVIRRMRGRFVQGDIWMDIISKQREVERTQHRNPDVDQELLVYFHPLTDTSWLLYPCAENRQLLCLTKDTLGATPYGYWNSSDQPADVTDDEWAQREAAWNEALGASCTLGNMLRFEASPMVGGLCTDACNQATETLRLDLFARAKLQADRWAIADAMHLRSNPATLRPSDFLRWFDANKVAVNAACALSIAATYEALWAAVLQQPSA